MTMKMKFAFLAVFFGGIIFVSAQDYSSNTESIRLLDSKIEDGQFKTDKKLSTEKLTLISSESSSQEKLEQEEFILNDKEWKKIKKQMKRNRKKVKNQEDYVHTYKKIDTIFLSPSKHSEKIELSGW